MTQDTSKTVTFLDTVTESSITTTIGDIKSFWWDCRFKSHVAQTKDGKFHQINKSDHVQILETWVRVYGN